MLRTKVRNYRVGKESKVGGIWATFLNSGGGTSTPEIDVPSPTAGSKVRQDRKHLPARCEGHAFAPRRAVHHRRKVHGDTWRCHVLVLAVGACSAL